MALSRCSPSFFSGCHYFIPVFDPSYDEFESFVQRTPFSFDGMLAVAAKIRAGAGQCRGLSNHSVVIMD
jgi:hypothetical protein